MSKPVTVQLTKQQSDYLLHLLNMEQARLWVHVPMAKESQMDALLQEVQLQVALKELLILATWEGAGHE
jgi:hypothetical protein